VVLFRVFGDAAGSFDDDGDVRGQTMRRCPSCASEELPNFPPPPPYLALGALLRRQENPCAEASMNMAEDSEHFDETCTHAERPAVAAWSQN
jgi:hypothetical protein